MLRRSCHQEGDRAGLTNHGLPVSGQVASTVPSARCWEWKACWWNTPFISWCQRSYLFPGFLPPVKLALHTRPSLSTKVGEGRKWENDFHLAKQIVYISYMLLSKPLCKWLNIRASLTLNHFLSYIWMVLWEYTSNLGGCNTRAFCNRVQ